MPAIELDGVHAPNAGRVPAVLYDASGNALNMSGGWKSKQVAIAPFTFSGTAVGMYGDTMLRIDDLYPMVDWVMVVSMRVTRTAGTGTWWVQPVYRFNQPFDFAAGTSVNATSIVTVPMGAAQAGPQVVAAHFKPPLLTPAGNNQWPYSLRWYVQAWCSDAGTTIASVDQATLTLYYQQP